MTAQRATRRPTGKPPWPIVLLAGVEGSGKSYEAAKASGSDLVGRTYWVVVGEDAPDEYGKVPGADFEIVAHDGTYRDAVAALEWASAQPQVDGKPTLIIVDSFGRAWDLLANMAQAEANARRSDARGEARIASDLWNLAGSRWDRMLDVMRRHAGPVIITARLERQTVFTEDGNPTKDKHNKVKAQKNLAYDAGVVVEMRDPFGPDAGAHVTKARSLTFAADPGRKITDFSIERLWRAMGLDEPEATAERQHTGLVVADAEDSADAARADLLALCQARGWAPAEIVAKYAAARPSSDLRTETDPAKIREFIGALDDPATDEPLGANDPAAQG